MCMHFMCIWRIFHSIIYMLFHELMPFYFTQFKQEIVKTSHQNNNDSVYHMHTDLNIDVYNSHTHNHWTRLLCIIALSWPSQWHWWYILVMRPWCKVSCELMRDLLMDFFNEYWLSESSINRFHLNLLRKKRRKKREFPYSLPAEVK